MFTGVKLNNNITK